MTKEEYSKLLKAPEWRNKRLQILKRDNYTCQKCYSKDNLHVHHIYYIQGNMPWEVPNEYLLTLCEICHAKEHTGKNISSFVIITKEKRKKAKYPKQKPKTVQPKKYKPKEVIKKSSEIEEFIIESYSKGAERIRRKILLNCTTKEERDELKRRKIPWTDFKIIHVEGFGHIKFKIFEFVRKKTCKFAYREVKNYVEKYI